MSFLAKSNKLDFNEMKEFTNQSILSVPRFLASLAIPAEVVVAYELGDGRTLSIKYKERNKLRFTVTTIAVRIPVFLDEE